MHITNKITVAEILEAAGGNLEARVTLKARVSSRDGFKVTDEDELDVTRITRTGTREITIETQLD